MRKRITIDDELYNAAIEYVRLDNRTFSELIQESLSQMMRRYPKKHVEYEHEQLRTLEKLVGKLIEENIEIKAKIAGSG